MTIRQQIRIVVLFLVCLRIYLSLFFPRTIIHINTTDRAVKEEDCDDSLEVEVEYFLTPFDVINMHEDFPVAMCLKFHKKANNADNKELSW